MEVRIRATGQVMFEHELRAAFPETSLPAQLNEATLDSLGADVVLEGPQAQPTRYQVAFRDGVEQVNGQWFTKYSVSDMDADGIAATDAAQAQAVRAERNRRIAELDWTQGKDIPDSISGPAALVRQALRDVPSQAGFPWTITWPDQSE